MKMSGIKEVKMYHVHSKFWCEVDYFSGRKTCFAHFPQSAKKFVDNANKWINEFGEESNLHNWKRERVQYGAGYVDIYGHKTEALAFHWD